MFFVRMELGGESKLFLCSKVFMMCGLDGRGIHGSWI